MKRGQATADFIILVGFVAAGLIAMLVYAGRGQQGNLRSQAEQLGTQQYEPGNTTVDNWETKHVTKTEKMSSSTTTKHSEEPQGEDNPAANAAYKGVEAAMSRLYAKMDQIDKKFQEEGLAKAAEVAAGGTWMWTPSGELNTLLDELYVIQEEIKVFYDTAEAANKAMPEREKNESHSGAQAMEHGTTTTIKSMDETIGGYR